MGRAACIRPPTSRTLLSFHSVVPLFPRSPPSLSACVSAVNPLPRSPRPAMMLIFPAGPPPRHAPPGILNSLLAGRAHVGAAHHTLSRTLLSSLYTRANALFHIPPARWWRFPRWAVARHPSPRAPFVYLLSSAHAIPHSLTARAPRPSSAPAG